MTAPIYIWALLMALALNKVWRRHRLAQHNLDPKLVDVIRRKKDQHIHDDYIRRFDLAPKRPSGSRTAARSDRPIGDQRCGRGDLAKDPAGQYIVRRPDPRCRKPTNMPATIRSSHGCRRRTISRGARRRTLPDGRSGLRDRRDP